MIELIQERISHLHTRRMLWQAQQQLLSLLTETSNGELAGLQKQLADASPAGQSPADDVVR